MFKNDKKAKATKLDRMKFETHVWKYPTRNDKEDFFVSEWHETKTQKSTFT
jgi:hypothetical protein